ncbi:MAG: tetratricopeptide repeat protein [Nitrospira sp.]
MNLGCLLLVSTLVTAGALPRLALADESQQVKTYRAQCDKGEGLACAVLGERYEHGEGVTQDFTQAAAFFRKACDGGYAEGCSNLGVAYEHGEGVKQSTPEALNYYGKACGMKDQAGCEALARLKKR